MNRVGIITFLHNGNYGSSLQAYALQTVVRNMGYECFHFNYCPDIREKIQNMIRCGNHPKLLLEGKKKKTVQEEQEGMRKKLQRIEDFYDRRMQLSPVCRNQKELAEVSRNLEVMLCGSDQIWNPVWLNPAYLLSFGNPEQPRIAYAASLGISAMPSRRKQKIFRRRLSLFDAVSVREEEGARILVSITGNRPPVMPDPVCLLERQEWDQISVPYTSEHPYLLCYFIGENPEYWERVQNLCEKKGLEAVVIPVTAEGYRQKQYKLLDGAGPEEFLGAVAGASMLCTDSFHGLAFGTIFEKQVDLIRRYRDDNPESKNSRVDHFLREIRQKGIPNMRREGLEWLAEQLIAQNK